MGMSTHVVGFRPPDERFRQMQAVYDGCVAAHVPVPDEVIQFFNGKDPDPSGVEVDLEMIGGVARDWSNKYAEGIEVDIRQMPADVPIIRFYNAW